MKPVPWQSRFIILVVLAAAAALSLAAGLEMKNRLPKPVVFSIEEWSRLRSPAIKPERASPIVTEDRIILLSSRKKLAVFNFDGKRESIQSLEFSPVSSPGFDRDRLFVGGSDGKFHCLSAQDGKEIWSADFRSLDFSTPAVSGGRVVFQIGRDLLICLRQETGERIWMYQHLRVEDLAVRGLCPPKVMDGVVYAGFSGGALAAFDLATGRLIWKSRTFKGEQFRDVDAPLEADETSIYAMSINGNLAAVSRKTGKTYWSFAVGGMAGLTLKDGMLYAASDDATINAFDKISGKLLWSTSISEKKKKRFFDLPTRPAVFGGTVLTVTRSGRVFALDGQTGVIEKEYAYFTDTSAPIVSAPGLGFLVMDNKGIVRIWKDGV